MLKNKSLTLFIKGMNCSKSDLFWRSMPRQARIVIPGVAMHVTQRGNFKSNVFMDDEDKSYYIRIFQFYKKKYRVKLYAWCLMDNHVHFILEPRNLKGLALLFKSLNVKYGHYLNKKLNRKGRIWEGRFSSCLLDEEHLYEAIRYVELNPIRAKLELQLGEYYWSSYHEHVGIRQEVFLNKSPVLISKSDWQEYLLAGLCDDLFYKLIKASTKQGKPIGKIDV